MLSKPQTVYPLGLEGFESDATRLARKGNLRRLLVFLTAFTAFMVLGQIWNLSRSEIYRTSSRLQIALADVSGPVAASSAAGLSTQAQVLTARPLLEQVARALIASGRLAGPADEAELTRLQSMLAVMPVPGTDVAVLQATGSPPALLADLLNTLPEHYRRDIEVRQRRAADAQLAGAQAELAKLEAVVADRRARLDRFRQQSGVQSEREENEAIARSKGLNTALNTAIEKEAAAEARLRAVEDGARQGRNGSQTREDPGVQALAARANQVREELGEMERTYTAEFMAMDPRARALRARLAELERQLVLQRSASQQINLNSVQEDLATARATATRLRAQLTAERPLLHSTAGRFVQAKSIEDDLAQVERARREMIERVARLEADERRRHPSVTVLDAAATPTVAISPDYRADALLVLGASLLFGLLATGLVELFNRSPLPSPLPTSNTLVMPGTLALGRYPTLPAAMQGTLALSGESDPNLALAAPVAALLDQSEAAALLGAARNSTRLVCAFMLMGLSAEEVIALKCSDVDVGLGVLRVGGAFSRALEMPPWLAAEAATAAARPAQVPDLPLLRDAMQAALMLQDLATMIACASVDAGLPLGAGLTPAVLRNTCVSWLVTQGLRFSDLPHRVGRVDPAMLTSFARVTAAIPRRGIEQTECLMPALQLPPST